jgi:ABC-type dipeptide/oligopeptide/nickel transport system permease component
MRYVTRRLLLAIPTFWAAVTLVFLLVRVAPGDPATAALGDYASKEAVEALRVRMGLNAPLWVQYLRFLTDLLRGDLGRSLITGQSLGEQIRFVLPYSLQLAGAAFLFGVGLGVPLGVISAVRRNSAVDHVTRIVSLVGLSVPAFYLGILLVLLLAIRLPLFPAVGGGDLANPLNTLRHLVLPTLTLGLVMVAYVTRMTRSVMLTVIGEDFVRTATGKGLSRAAVLYRHALRAAAVPLVSLIGLFAITLIGGSVLTEVVFSRPGLGKLMVGAMLQRDYVALQAIMAVYSAIIVVVNLLTDLLYGVVDPRTRLAGV